MSEKARNREGKKGREKGKASETYETVLHSCYEMNGITISIAWYTAT